ncbi:O-antigen polymerase [Bacillus sp. JJ864]|uniref:O-antigen polymerase n=1 Tax=Bacillus sp. JJ864 TaxID=3122975 RepID=UPI0030003DA0
MFFVFFGKLRSGRFYNPISFYMLFWGFWILISLSNPFGLYEVSEKTYFTILLSLFCFGIGCILIDSSKILIKENDSIITNDNSFTKLNSKRFLILQFIIFAILFFYYLKYSSLLSSMTLDDQRRIVYTVGLLFNSTYEMLFYNWIIKPIMMISVIMVMVNYIIYGRKNVSLVISLLNCVLFSFIGNGRLIYFDLLIYILIAVAFKKSFSKFKQIPKFHIRKSTLKKSILFIIGIFVLLYVMNSTSARRIGLENPSLYQMWDTFVNYSFKQGIVYFTGPLRALDYFLTSNIADSVGYTFGRSSFAGIEEVIVSFLSSFLHDPSIALNSANYTTSSFTVPNIQIGTDQTFNALYTHVMNFYLDCGLIGIVVLSTLYGIISGIVFKYCLRNINIYKISLLVYYIHHLVVSEFRWDYQSPASWIIIFSLIIISKRYEKRIIKNDVQETRNRKRIKIVF